MKKLSMLGMAAGLAIGLMAGGAQAQNYPNHSIKIIVPYSVGGPTDTVARIMAEKLSERVGQSVVVQTLLGGGGIVGTEAASRAKPDGYTLYFGANSMAIYPHVRPAGTTLSFDPLDFVAVGGIARSAHVLLASKSSGIHSVAELVENAKKQLDETVTYGSAGVGGTTHLPLAFFARDAGITLLHVPYKGAAPAMVDLLAGRIDLSTPGYSAALNEPIDSGKVVALAVTSAQRLSFLPKVPTLVESGYPNMEFPIWYALFAPKGTPQEVVDRISKELEVMAQDPEYAKKLADQGNEAAYVSPKDLHDTLAQQTKDVGERIHSLGLQF